MAEVANTAAGPGPDSREEAGEDSQAGQGVGCSPLGSPQSESEPRSSSPPVRAGSDAVAGQVPGFVTVGRSPVLVAGNVPAPVGETPVGDFADNSHKRIPVLPLYCFV